MSWEFDTENVDTSKMKGFVSPAAGFYHFQVTNVDEEGGNNGEMIVDAEVLAGSVPNQEGTSQREYFTKSASAEGRALQFAVAVGLTTVEEIEAAKNSRQNLSINFKLAEGRQFVGEVRDDEYNGKIKQKLDFRMYPLDSPAAARVPKCEGMLQQHADAADDPFGGPQVPDEAPGTQDATDPPADPFGGLL